MPEPAHCRDRRSWFAALVIAVTAAVLFLSYWPARNMLSSHQRMNMSFNPFHLVNTYGAFGSIGRVRREVVIEGTDEHADHRADGLEGIRIQGQARCRAPAAAPMGALSSATGLADVVRRHLAGLCAAVADAVSAAAAAQRSRRRCACCGTIPFRIRRPGMCARSSTSTASRRRPSCGAIGRGGIGRLMGGYVRPDGAASTWRTGH